RHTRFSRDWSSDVCSSDLADVQLLQLAAAPSVDLRSHQPARLQLGFDVYLGRLGRQPTLALYSLHRTAAGWVHTLGLGFGTCRESGRASCRGRAWRTEVEQ